MHLTKCRFWGGVVQKFQITKKTKITDTVVALNDLQSNYQTLLEQENVQINLPLVKFEYQKQVLKKLNNGALYNALRNIPIIHVAGTKVRILYSIQGSPARGIILGHAFVSRLRPSVTGLLKTSLVHFFKRK